LMETKNNNNLIVTVKKKKKRNPFKIPNTNNLKRRAFSHIHSL
jgi:hypothetical protein